MKKEKRTVKVTEKKLADGVIKLDCEATAIEVNNALKEAVEAFAMQMGVRPAPGKSIEEAAKEQLGISDLDKIVEPNAIRGARCPGRSTAATSCRRSRPRQRPP